MGILELIIIAVGLAMDCFAVSIGIGITSSKIKLKKALIISLFFGIFQGIMPIIGWFIGKSFSELINNVDHWIACGILVFIGLKMIIEALNHSDEKTYNTDKFWVLIGLSIATSIDALVVGLGLGLLNTNIIFTGVIIAIITLIISFAGIFLGKKFKMVFGNWAKIMGGIILIGIGVKIVFEHINY